MLTKAILSVAMAMALGIGSTQPSKASCVLVSAASSQACHSDCCGNKTCCATSQARTARPVQPLAKTTSVQQKVPTLATTDRVVLPVNFSSKSSFVFKVERVMHSPAPLALNCIRLI